MTTYELLTKYIEEKFQGFDFKISKFTIDANMLYIEYSFKYYDDEVNEVTMNTFHYELLLDYITWVYNQCHN